MQSRVVFQNQLLKDDTYIFINLEQVLCETRKTKGKLCLEILAILK